MLNGRRRVRQDDSIKVTEDGVVTLDTVPVDAKTDLISKEDTNDDYEEDFSILETFSDSVVDADIVDTPIDIDEIDIEEIVKTVQDSEGEVPPILMVTGEDDSDNNVGVRFLQSESAKKVLGGSPIVVINIHADQLGLSGKEKQSTESDRNVKSSLKEVIPVTVDDNLTEDTSAAVISDDETKSPDYLDFDTDYITITMESDYGDR